MMTVVKVAPSPGSKFSQPCSYCEAGRHKILCRSVSTVVNGYRSAGSVWATCHGPVPFLLGWGIRTHRAHELLPAVGCTRRLHVLEVRIGEVCMQIQQNGGIRFFTLSATRCLTRDYFWRKLRHYFLPKNLNLVTVRQVYLY